MDSIHDLTAAYALDALDADEARAYEAHLAQCEECRTQLAALSDTATSLAWAVDAPAPPDRLRASILAEAAAERTNVVPLRRSPVFRATAAVAAIAACAAVALGIWGATRSGSSCAAGWRCSALADGRGVVTVDPMGQGVLVVHLPAAPAGKTYEAWVIEKGAARPAGTFASGDGTTIVRLTRTVPRGALVAATVERAGGVQAPTSAPLFSVRA
jgi:anti-sigma-K factor RskA